MNVLRYLAVLISFTWSMAEVSAAQSPGTGLTAQYFANPFLLGKPTLQRVDPVINFNWGSAASDALGTVADEFSVRWIGQLVVPTSGTWTIFGTSDDGLIVEVDGKLLINDWSDHAAREASASIDLVAGKQVSIKIAFYENKGLARAQLAWSGPGTAKQVIPQASLYPFVAQATIPTESFASPAFVEGQKLPGSTLKVLANGAPVASIELAESKGYANVPLTVGQAVPVTVATTKGAITWTPTVLMGDTERTIRVGDALLFKASVTGSWRIATSTGIFKPSEPIEAGAQVPYTFATPGTYLVEGLDQGGTVVGSSMVTVVAVGLPPAIACEIQYERATEAIVTPAGAQVAFGTNDASSASVKVSAVTGGLISLQVKPLRRGLPGVVARIGGETGPVVGFQPIDEFILETPALAHAVVNARTEIGHVELVMRPFVPNVDITAAMFAHRSTFKGGATKFIINTSGPASSLGEGPFTKVKDPSTGEQNGAFVFSLEIPSDENRYCFSVMASQDTIAVGSDEGVGSSTTSIDSPAQPPFGTVKHILAAMLFANGGGSPQGSPKKNVNGKACKVAGFNTLLFAKADDPTENEKANGNQERFTERTYSLLTAADCTDENNDGVADECADVSYKIITKSPGGRKVDNPLKGRFFKTDTEESNCKNCPHSCETFDTMKAGTKTGKHENKVAICGGKGNDGTEIGAFYLGIIDAAGPKNFSDPFPTDTCVVRKRRGVLYEGSGPTANWVGEPVIEVVSGGSPVITEEADKGSQTISFYGVQCAGTNKWNLEAHADGFDSEKHQLYWFVEDAVKANGKTEIDNDDNHSSTIEDLVAPRKLVEVPGTRNKLAVEIKPAIGAQEVGRWNIVLLIVRSITATPEKKNTGTTYLQVLGKAEIHSFAVEPKHSANLPKAPEKQNADPTGIACGSQFSVTGHSGAGTVDAAIYVKGTRRGRVSLDGYPQNEYWCGPQDSLDLPQMVGLPEGGRVLARIQGYGSASSDKNDKATLAVDGQALIEQCAATLCGSEGQEAQEIFQGTPIDWLWQRCDTEQLVNVEVVVHPTSLDFAAGKKGRILQSIRGDLVNGNQFYTTVASTLGNTGAQRIEPANGGPDAKTWLKVSAHIKPYDYVAGQSLQFGIYDLHDLSPYNIGNQRKKTGSLSFEGGNSAPIQQANSYGSNVGIAELDVNLKDADAGDQFRILAGDPQGNLYGVGDRLVIWRKMYIESDTMYALGTYVTDGRSLTPGGGDVNLTVLSSAGATVGQNIVLFGPNGREITATIKGINNPRSLTIGNYQVDQAVQIEEFWGVRPSGNVATSSGIEAAFKDAREKAYGGSSSYGEDGGAFTEFAATATGANIVPYNDGGNPALLGTAQLRMVAMAEAWFAHSGRKENVAHLIYGFRVFDQDGEHSEPGGFAEADPSLGTSNNVYLILDAPFLEQNNTSRAQALCHEFGHILGVVPGNNANGGAFPWVDPKTGVPDKKAHDPSTFCIMDYASNLKDDLVEFSTDVLFYLRKRNDPDK